MQSHLLDQVPRDDDTGDKAVDAQNLGHDCAQRVLHEAVGPDDAAGEDGPGRFGGAVAGTHDGEDNGAGTTHSAEKGLPCVSSPPRRASGPQETRGGGEAGGGFWSTAVIGGSDQR